MTKINPFAASVNAALVGLTVNGKTSVAAGIKLADSIKRRSAKLDVDIHAVMVAACRTSVENGDTSLAAAVLNSLGKAMRAKTAAQWFETLTNIRTDFDKVKGWTCKLTPKDDRIEVNLKRCLETPFWTAAEKVDAGAFDDIRMWMTIDKLIKAAKDGADLSENAKAMLADLKVMSAKLAPAEPAA